MKIQPYVTRLGNSKEYKDFVKKYDDAFLIAGFFVIDLEGGKNIHQIDYYIPSEKKIAAFTLDDGITLQILETMNHLVPEKLDIKTTLDLDALPGVLEDEMKNRNITDELKKIIAVVQNIGGKRIWNLNCVLSGMGILRAHVEDESKTVLKMEKASIMDYIKKMPAQALQKMQKPAEVPEEEAAEMDADAEESPEQLKQKMEQLQKLGAALEKEKNKVEKELENKSAIAKSPKEEATSPSKDKKNDKSKGKKVRK